MQTWEISKFRPCAFSKTHRDFRIEKAYLQPLLTALAFLSFWLKKYYDVISNTTSEGMLIMGSVPESLQAI